MSIDMTNDIRFKISKPEIGDYWNLFKTTGWNEGYKFSIDELNMAIENSSHSISAYNNEKLIGYGRLISDGIHHALIIDLIISPKYQANGIGSEILRRLLKKCTDNNIRDIQLFSAKDKFEFYEKFGFEKRNEEAPGMEYKY